MRAAEFLRDLVARELITVTHVPGAVMIADLLTKATSRAIFHVLVSLIDEFATSHTATPPA